MRLGVDARLLESAGIGRYLKNLINQLQILDKKNDYFIFLLKNDLGKLALKKNFQEVVANFGWYSMEEQIKYPPLLEKYHLDLVHFPHFNVPIFYNGSFIVTIHDLIHQKFNMRSTRHSYLGYKLHHLGYQYVFKTAVVKSQRILTVSHYTKSQLINKWRVPEKKIVVTYEGADEMVALAKTKLKRPNVPTPYLLYVGSAHPHKNVEGLIEAFKKIKLSSKNLHLVLVGKKSFFWDGISKRYPDVSYISSVDDIELASLYRGASLYVQPSFEEGFGLPLLEAMAIGCPVVSSNAASLPEVGGDAAVYFNPENPQDIVEKIQQVLNNQKLKKELIEKGKARVRDFSFKKMTEKTLETYQEAI